MAIISGNRTTIVETGDHLLDIEQGIKYLNPKDNGIKFVKKLLANSGGEVAKSSKHAWRETAIPTNRETVTIAADSTTDLTVADAYAYTVGDVLLIEAEYMIVTVLKDADEITVTRGDFSSTAAAHSGKVMYNLGNALAESTTGVTGMTTATSELYNYVQTMEMAVDMSTNEIAEMSSEMGNPFNKQLERITLAYWRRFGNNAWYGVRNLTGTTRHMGGIKSFVTTNVTNVAGALTIATIDAKILAIMQAGGYADLIVTSPYQKQKLDAIDTAKQYLGKREHTGGQLVTNTWQSGVIDYELDVMVDQNLKPDELYILDSSKIALIPLVNNGISGRLALFDTTPNGADYKKTVLRSKYTLKVENEGSLGYLYGLS